MKKNSAATHLELPMHDDNQGFRAKNGLTKVEVLVADTNFMFPLRL